MEAAAATVTRSGRRLRSVTRRRYDDGDISDDEIEGKRSFDLDEKLRSDNYGADFVCSMHGRDFSYRYVQEEGLRTPLVFSDPDGLNMKMPGKDFSVDDVKMFVGSRRMVDVMDVTTQRGTEMTMSQWAAYYSAPADQRHKLYNVISLEFSHTRLEGMVQRPAVVDQVDWVDTMWPRHLKQKQRDATNVIAQMKYPKVQKYCLMSVRGCYTDFHIDFGGTSVWYHILRGGKVFWMIPPTQRNLDLYETWVLSGKQGDVFLGDRVEGCQRIALHTGYTFVIPSGWIHAVYTPEDALVFGGNFLHSFNIPMQLRIYAIEDKTRVPAKFRYPFYYEMGWYVLERYVYCLTRRSHLTRDYQIQSLLTDEHGGRPTGEEEELKDEKAGERSRSLRSLRAVVQISPLTSPAHQPLPALPLSPKTSSSSSSSSSSSDDELDDPPTNPTSVTKVAGKSNFRVASTPPPPPAPRRPPVTTDEDVRGAAAANATPPLLTSFELEGLGALLKRLQTLPANKRCVPDGIHDPDKLLHDIRAVLDDHEEDDAELALSGVPVVSWPQQPTRVAHLSLRTKTSSYRPSLSISGGGGGASAGGAGAVGAGVGEGGAGVARHRRTRCRKCVSCRRAECGACPFCRDMRKFGGPGRQKQSCMARQCSRPVLPHVAACAVCGLGGTAGPTSPPPSTELMECSVCNEIVHPACLKVDVTGAVIHEDLPNCWKCPKCNKGAEPITKRGPGFKFAPAAPPSIPRRGADEVGAPPRTPSPPSGRPRNSKQATDPSSSLSCSSTSSPNTTTTSSPNTTTTSSPSTSVSSSSSSASSSLSSCSSASSSSSSSLRSLRLKPHRQHHQQHHQHHQQQQGARVLIGREMVLVPKLRHLSPSAAAATADTAEAASSSSSSAARPQRSLSCEGPAAPHGAALGHNGARAAPPAGRGPSPKRGRGVVEAPPPHSLMVKRLRSEVREDASSVIATGATLAERLRNRMRQYQQQQLKRQQQQLKRQQQHQHQQQHNSGLRGTDAMSLYRIPKKMRGGGGGGGGGRGGLIGGRDVTVKIDRLTTIAATTVARVTVATPQEEKLSSPQPTTGGHVATTTATTTDKREDDTYDDGGGGGGGEGGGGGGGGCDSPRLTEMMAVVVVNQLRPDLISSTVVRTGQEEEEEEEEEEGGEDALQREVWVNVFPFLTNAELCNCMRVCKAWNRWCSDSRLWARVALCGRARVSADALSAVVRKQPSSLLLAQSRVSHKQMVWLLGRLPGLRELCLSGCHWAAVSALVSARSAPLLRSLDVSHAHGATDELIRQLFQPGAGECRSRLRCVTTLDVSGLPVGEAAVRALTRHAPRVARLRVRRCAALGDAALGLLLATGNGTRHALTHLSLAGCERVTDRCLSALCRCVSLRHLDMSGCVRVSPAAFARLAHSLTPPLTVIGERLAVRADA